MAHYVLVRSKVENFDTWKKAFDGHSAARDEVGLKVLHLLRTENEAGETTLLFSVKDLAKAKAFLSSPDLREAMQKSGVIGRPDIHFLHD